MGVWEGWEDGEEREYFGHFFPTLLTLPTLNY
jgi:hypothetical protein